MNQLQEFPEFRCAQHSEIIKGICMFPDCNSRYMCRQCRKVHPNSHLNEFEDLEEILSGRLADDIHKNLQTTNQQIEEQERISQNNSHTLITSIEGHFNEIQNHIMQKLNETRELIIMDIKNKFKENTTVKQEIINHSDRIYENFKVAQANNFSNAHQLNNLINSLCNAQLLRARINNDPELQTLQRGDLAQSYFIMSSRLRDHYRVPFDKLCNDLINSFQINRNPYQTTGTSSIPRIGANLFENISFEPTQFSNPFTSNRPSIPKGNRLPEPNLFQDRNAFPLFNTIFQNQNQNQGGFNLGGGQNDRFNIGQPDLSNQQQRILPTLLTPHNSLAPQQPFGNNFMNNSNPSPFKIQPDLLNSNSNLLKAAQEQLQLRTPHNSVMFGDPNNPGSQNPPSQNHSKQPTPSRLASSLLSQIRAEGELPKAQTPENQATLVLPDPEVPEEEGEEGSPVQEIVTEKNTDRILIEDDEGNTIEEVTETQNTMLLETLEAEEEQPPVKETPQTAAKQSVSPLKIIEIMRKQNEIEKASANSKNLPPQQDFGRVVNQQDYNSQVTFGANTQQEYDPEESVKQYLTHKDNSRRRYEEEPPQQQQHVQPQQDYANQRDNRRRYEEEQAQPQPQPQQDLRRRRETIEQRGYLMVKNMNVSTGIDYISKKSEWAFGSNEGLIQIWNANPREYLQQIRAHNGEIFALKYIKEKNVLLSCSADGEVGVWNTNNNYKSGGFFKKHDKQPVYCVEYLPEFDEVVSAGEDGVLRFWSIEGVQEKDTVKIPNAKIYSICYLNLGKDNKMLLAATERGVVHVVTLGEMKVLTLQKTQAHDSIISKMQFFDSKGNKIVVTGSYDGFVKVWNLKEDGTLHLHKRLGRPGSQVMGFIVVPQSGLIVSSHDDGHIRLWRGSSSDERMLMSKQDETFGQNIIYYIGHHNYPVILTGARKMVKLWSLNAENLFEPRQ